MTQKEKLYEQLLIAENGVLALQGEQVKDIEAMKRDWRFASDAKSFTLEQLKVKISFAKSFLETAKQAKAVEEYFATSEGAKRKQELEEQREANLRALTSLRDRYIAEAKAIIEPILPENWKMDCTEITCINIFLTDPVDGKKVFGHEFELRLNTDWDKDYKTIYTITTNIGTMGSFDPTKNFKRVSLYKVFADIVSNRQLIEDLKSIMIQAYASKQQSSENIRNIDKQLKNPLA